MMPNSARLALLVAVFAAAPAAAQPANDDCANATIIGALPFADTVDMTTATTEPGDPVSACFGGQGTNSIWYRVPAGDDGTLIRGLVGGTGSEYGIRAWAGSCGALTEIVCQYADDFFTEFGIAAEGQAHLLEIVNLATPGTLDLTLDVFPEFLVARDTGRDTLVGGGPNGFLVAYTQNSFDMGRLYDAAGEALGPQFALGDFAAYDVTGAGDGSFFAVGSGTGGDAVRIDGQGVVTPLPAVAVSGYPKVAADAGGNFVVVWNPPGPSVQGQRFDRDGTPQGVPFLVTSAGAYPSVAMAPSGEFVVTWEGSDGSGAGVIAQRYDDGGAPVGSALVVNPYTTNSQGFPAVAMDASGAFVVVWEDTVNRYFPGQGYFDRPVMARRFDSLGTPITGELLVSDDIDYQYDGVTSYIRVANAANGEFVVTWEGFGFTVVDIHAHRFKGDGTPDGSEFFVNTFTGGYSSYDPDVAATPAGDFLVVWDDFRGFFNDLPPDYAEYGALARHFPSAGTACGSTSLPACRAPTTPLKSKLLLLDEPDDTDDQLRWKFVKGAATDGAALGDPTTDEDYVLCMYDASSPGGALLMENRIPAGGTCGTKPCWKALGNPPGSKGYRYKSKARTPHGILKMVVKPGVDGKSKVVIKGGQDHVFTGGPGAPPLPLPLPVTVQLQNRSGECWQATYDTAGVGTNEAGFYKGSGS